MVVAGSHHRAGSGPSAADCAFFPSPRKAPWLPPCWGPGDCGDRLATWFWLYQHHAGAKHILRGPSPSDPAGSGPPSLLPGPSTLCPLSVFSTPSDTCPRPHLPPAPFQGPFPSPFHAGPESLCIS